MKNKIAVEDMTEKWFLSGLKSGDTVLIHSDLKRTFWHYFTKGQIISVDDVLTSLLNAVGSNGTVLLPLFNFNFAAGGSFDLRNTPSQMGALSEYARLHPMAERTRHPIYSFAAIGRDAEIFGGIDNYSGYGGDSPFGKLRELDGKIAAIGLPDHKCMTFYHHVEELHNVPYRYHKEFKGVYTDFDGLKEIKAYGLYVRDLEKKIVTHVEPMEKILWKQGIYTGCRTDEGSGMRVAKSREMFALVSEVIAQDKAEGLLYKISS